MIDPYTAPLRYAAPHPGEPLPDAGSQPDPRQGADAAADLVVRGAQAIVTCRGPAPRRGPAQRDVNAIPGGVVAARAGRITFVGSAADAERSVRTSARTRIVDATGCTVLPGLIDTHTHVVYAGDRRGELRERLAGATYEELAARGGGILATVRATRAATEAELAADAQPRLREMLAAGTTTCEAKSGYGLDTEAELKMLRAIRRLNADGPIEVTPTFLGAHEVPPDFRSRRREYVDLVVRGMIPAVASGGLAEWCDVFCERGVFTPEESREILEAGAAAGLKPRIHADELADSGGSRVAAALRARSADHLVHVSAAGIGALAEAGVVATLLPVAALYLKLGRFAPARALIDAGVPVALATDVNPGGGLSPSLPFAMALGCFAMHMTLEEAVIAATLNAAYAIDRHGTVGSLEVGKQMDAVIVRGDLLDLVRVGAPVVAQVVKKGRVVVDAARPAGRPRRGTR